MLPFRELARNPYLALSNTQESCIPEWTHLFPISLPEPWKVARQRYWSKWVNSNGDMQAGRFPENELAPHGFATSASGITVYRGSALGSGYSGNAFIGEPANNVVVRLRLEERGLEVVAKRPEAEALEQREFLASTDNWFRPVNFANGPDGCLYIAAMYREIIEDETALPGDILQHYDLLTGRDRGRILRVRPENFTRPAQSRLSHAKTAELVDALKRPDVWWRETAQRLLYERQDKNAVPPLALLAASAPLPQTRVHALWSLYGMSALDEETLAHALSDSDFHVRAHALQLAPTLIGTSVKLRARVLALADDPEIQVRFRAVFALGLMKDAAAVEGLAAIARRDASDRWMRSALAVAVPERSAALIAALLYDERFLANLGAAELLGSLAQITGARDNREEVAQVIELFSQPSLARLPEILGVILRQLADGLGRAGSSLGDHLAEKKTEANHGSLSGFFERARHTAFDPAKRENDRVEAIQLLAFSPAGDTNRTLGRLLDSTHPSVIQLAALRGLSSRTGKEVAEIIINQWQSFGPAVRPDAVEALFRRPERLGIVLDAMEKGAINLIDIDPRRREALLHQEDEALRKHAQSLFVTAKSKSKDELIARMGREVMRLIPDAARGERVFKNVCAVCHKPETGARPGPDLATLEDRSPGTLITAILDPNREVKPNYVNYELTTKDGQDLGGVIAVETPASVTLRRAGGGEEIVLRRNIKSLRSTNLSLMPEGLEGVINPQQMADLLLYLKTMKE